MPVRTGSNSRLQAAWSASPTVWTIAGWFRLNSVNGMMMFRSKAAAIGSTGAFAENNGTTLTNYTQTSAGGASDQIPGDQSLYNTGAALVPLMMTRNGNVVTVFNPNYPSGRSFNIATFGAIMSEVAAADTLAFGAWVQQGTVTLPIDQDCDEPSAWTLAASATEYAAFAAATKPEDIGDATFKASMFDVWTLNPGGAGGTAIADGTTYTGLKNSNVLTLIGTTATVSSRAAPVSRVAPPVLSFSGVLDVFSSDLQLAQFVPNTLIISANLDVFVSGLALAQQPGVINFGPLTNGSGFRWDRSDITATIKDRTTDALVATLTNVTSGPSGGSLSHISIVSGGLYRVTFRIPAGGALPNGAEGTTLLSGA